MPPLRFDPFDFLATHPDMVPANVTPYVFGSEGEGPGGPNEGLPVNMLRPDSDEPPDAGTRAPPDVGDEESVTYPTGFRDPGFVRQPPPDYSYTQGPPGSPPQEYIKRPRTDIRPGQLGRPDQDLIRAANYPGVDPSPYMVQPWQFNQVMQQVYQFLGQNSSYNVMRGLPQNIDFLNGYLNASNRGQRQAASNMLAGWRASTEELRYRSAAEMQDYEDLRHEFGMTGLTEGQPVDKAKLEQLKKALDDYARSKGDSPMQKLVENSATTLSDIDEMFKQRHENWLTWGKATSNKEKEAEEKEQQERQNWGEGTKPSQPTAPTQPRAPGTTQDQTTQQPPASPATTAGIDEQIMSSRPGMSQDEMAAAHQALNGTAAQGYSTLSKSGTGPRANIDYAARQLQNAVAHAATEPGPQGESIDSAVDRRLSNIGKIDPTYGSTLTGLTNYMTPPTSVGNPSQRKGEVQMAHLVDPRYNESIYPLVAKYNDANTTQGKDMTAAAQMATAYVNVVNALKRMPGGENGSIVENQIQALIANNWTGDSPYAALWGALNQFAINQAALSSKTGTTRVAILNNILKHARETGAPRAIRAQLFNDMQDTWALIGNFQRDWVQKTHKNTFLPLLSPNEFDIYSAALRSNSETGQYPSDAPRPLRVASIDPKYASTRVAAQDRWEPLTRQGWLQLYQWVAESRKSTDPAVIAAIPDAERRLGYTVDQPDLVLGPSFTGAANAAPP